jgi:hypothetical protein
MTTLGWLIHAFLLWLCPEFRLRVDRREFDGYRYTAVCAVLYQQPATMMCLEVPR